MTDLEFLASYDPKSGKPMDVYFHGEEALVIGVTRDKHGELVIDLDVRNHDRDESGCAGWDFVVACVEEITFSPEA